MPSKVYLDAPPDGDFRAMPAGGGGYAVLKWVTSFPGNPARALPTVTGVVLLSDASTGELRAMLDAGAVTALRTGAAAVLAAETLARPTVAAASVVGCGVNGRAVARAFLERERDVLLYDALPRQAAAAPRRSWASAPPWPRPRRRRSPPTSSSPSRRAARSSSTDGALHAGQHVSLMGADGPGKAEISVDELLRARVVCDEWEQASHNGDSRRAVDAGRLSRDDVANSARCCSGSSRAATSEHEITVFDSTGLAVQDLAVAIAVYERYTAHRGEFRPG